MKQLNPHGLKQVILSEAEIQTTRAQK